MTQGKSAPEPVFDFDDWYKGRVDVDERGALQYRELSDHARDLRQRFERFKTEGHYRFGVRRLGRLGPAAPRASSE